MHMNYNDTTKHKKIHIQNEIKQKKDKQLLAWETGTYFLCVVDCTFHFLFLLHNNNTYQFFPGF